MILHNISIVPLAYRWNFPLLNQTRIRTGSRQLDEVTLIALTLDPKAFVLSEACRVRLQLEWKQGWVVG